MNKLKDFEERMIKEAKVYRDNFPEWLKINVDDALREMHHDGVDRRLLFKCREAIYAEAMETVRNYPIAITLIHEIVLR